MCSNFCVVSQPKCGAVDELVDAFGRKYTTQNTHLSHDKGTLIQKHNSMITIRGRNVNIIGGEF